MDKKKVLCSYCPKKGCFVGDLKQAPDFCPTVKKPEIIERAKQELEDPTKRKMAQDVARTWKDYGKLTRVEETVLYAKLRGYRKIGLAFCVGLSNEAELFTNLLINEGFEVVSVCCMNGALTSDDVQLPEEEKIVPGFRQPMCNPIGQALLLNQEKCDLNVLLGLCVGDDTLFIKHSEAPVTVLAVKDRVLAHNPLAALYTARQIYTRINVRKPKG
ncbi:MAG: DUF1847 domain-containing protein [Deltaproteobacteria bacterium]|nr:DUF1847 domain-containing protein [Deltaproteobacteria bacterium]